jgi:hypothetical protein
LGRTAGEACLVLEADAAPAGRPGFLPPPRSPPSTCSRPGHRVRLSVGRAPGGEAEPVHQPRSTRDAVGDVELPAADRSGHPRRGPHLVLHPAVRGRAQLEKGGEFLPAAQGQTAP